MQKTKMQSLQTFNFNHQQIRIQNADGQIWFCGTDVARAIGYKNAAPPKRAFEVRDIVMVDYGGGDRQQAMVLNFLANYAYVKLTSGKVDIVTSSQISQIEANQ